jgi:hypothetical protein
MSRKGGYRFSEKDMRQNRFRERIPIPVKQDALSKPLILRAFCHISQMRPIVDLG